MGRAECILSSRPARRFHPTFYARRHTVPRAYLASTLLDVLPFITTDRGVLPRRCLILDLHCFVRRGGYQTFSIYTRCHATPSALLLSIGNAKGNFDALSTVSRIYSLSLRILGPVRSKSTPSDPLSSIAHAGRRKLSDCCPFCLSSRQWTCCCFSRRAMMSASKQRAWSRTISVLFALGPALPASDTPVFPR